MELCIAPFMNNIDIFMSFIFCLLLHANLLYMKIKIIFTQLNAQFPLWHAPTGNHGSGIHQTLSET